ncbi:sensor histidine kinase [Polaribacter porphyrae]|uniref:histidine kinase n=1 Tax=Polaribacter porphyrae TaxID=1137780 RepID=A0A2S7WT05_9FLAO|nr:HAMP domain-containing sensor histidine kinase [Polaribacter porphyrae]PQJ80586.1 two-component sensor histidine kinase [Polaribacter porphyrae]
MNTQKYKWILYLITVTIVATIGVQFYWNYKNYEENKQRVANEIQLSFDNAVEEYYSTLAKNDFLTIINSDSESKSIKLVSDTSVDTIVKGLDKKSKVTLNNIRITTDDNLSKEKIDSIMKGAEKFAKEFNFNKAKKKRKAFTSFTKFIDHKKGIHVDENGKKSPVKYFKGKAAADSLKMIYNLKPIFISFLDQSVNYEKIDSLIQKQLNNKGIKIESSFHHIKNDSIFNKTKDTLSANKIFTISSKSTYVKNDEKFKLLYSNPSFEALKRSSLGIFLSFLLSIAVISSLFYLLKIINQQKELASIKNDLISNITHEFKTPIATVSTAIEAIENFNVLDDKTKTQKYLSLSSIQLKKLHQMVEKLLETATLDSEQLLLKKETIDAVEIVEKIVHKHQLLAKNKEILFSSNLKPIYLYVDVFHFENVVSNLIDNAVKYGGNTIEVNINSILNSTEIMVADDGEGIEKNQQEKVFDQFYRVPKGNTHDVKGFGIGLYYCRKIIEKHLGNLTLSSTKQQTIFKITLPNEKS